MVRENNEDALLLKEPCLFAVADGMGGAAAGEVASHEALRAFGAAAEGLFEEGAETPEAILKKAVGKANDHIFALASANADYQGMGTTLTALYLKGDGTACAAHVGDSRLYLCRDGALSQITHDHSYVANLIEKQEITDSEAMTHPKRNLLLKAVGVGKPVEPDITMFAVEKGDLILLCTDGLSDMLTDDEMEKALNGRGIEDAADALLERALENGGRDNVTFIFILAEEGVLSE
ncbi:MAG: Stp1/IreP family PP2C-type Ser/Thr phosphatase [Phascolarctobacterium sp.]|nr:Stp1/IreP family PP2C-type Ser/Thr phosphatase [Phascolarctobacterium sp.]